MGRFLDGDVNDDGNVTIHIWLSMQFLHDEQPPYQVLLEKDCNKLFVDAIVELDGKTTRPIQTSMNWILLQQQRRPFMRAPVFCCEFWTPFWGSEGSLSSKDDTHSCSKPVTSHLHDFSNHSLELQHTLLKFCTSSVKLQSRKTKVSLHVSNIHVPCC